MSDWDLWYPNCDPIGYLLREAFPDRWVRFHSLHESKRYPEGEAEYAEVLARHNAILGELARPGERVVLLTTEGSDESESGRLYDPAVRVLGPGAVEWRTIAMHDANDASSHPNYWHVFANEWVWHPRTFDPIVRLVADAVVVNVLMVAHDCRWVLHPYDGGMDVIAEGVAERDRLASRYAGWLSEHASGL